VMVFYDYRAGASGPVTDAWRAKISAFEGRPFPVESARPR
jgi:hypothetical protein